MSIAYFRQGDFVNRDDAIRDILKHLQIENRHSDKIPRPFIIEITGIPSSGKTTLIAELDTFFRGQGLRVLCPQEGAQVIRHVSRSTPLYNLRTALYALPQLIDYASDHRYDIVIFERCLFDAYCWMMYWREKGKISLEEEEQFQKFFLSRFWVDKIDLAYFVVCDPAEAMRRYNRIAERGASRTTNTLTPELYKRFLEAYQILGPLHSQLHLVDTTSMDEVTMIDHVIGHTLFELQKRIHI